MKILRLLNNKIFSILLILFLSFKVFAEDQPIDIWNIEKNENNTQIEQLSIESKKESKEVKESDIYKMQNQKKLNTIKLDDTLDAQKINIYGLFDPEDHDLDINMWSNSNGDQLKSIFFRLNKIDLSEDASEIMQIALLTNAYLPEINISEKEFFDIRSNWLIKNSNLKLIEEYLIKNQVFDLHPKLTRYVVDKYLSEANVKKACDIFSKNTKPIKDEYLSKFNIYCLIKLNQKEKAQLILDLKKELGFR